MNARKMVIVAAALLLIGSGSIAMAKQPSGETPPRPPRPAMAPRAPMAGGPGLVDRMIELGLDDAQILKLTELHQAHLERTLPLKRELHELMDQQQELGEDVTGNRDAIVKISKRIGNLQADLEGMRIDLLTDSKKVLTDEQLEKLGDRELFGMRGERRGMHDGRRFSRGPRMGQTPPPAPDSPEPELDH